jgi:hypothetical protein
VCFDCEITWWKVPTLRGEEEDEEEDEEEEEEDDDDVPLDQLRARARSATPGGPGGGGGGGRGGYTDHEVDLMIACRAFGFDFDRVAEVLQTRSRNSAATIWYSKTKKELGGEPELMPWFTAAEIETMEQRAPWWGWGWGCTI